MRNVTEFDIPVIVVTKTITYKFLRGVLLMMYDRFADGVFDFAILALLNARQIFIVFASARQG